MRKTTRKGWVRKLDKICGDIVKQRDLVCVVCGRGTQITSGHLFSRVAYSTRWDTEYNLYAQCLSCNLKHEYDPYPLMKYAVNLHGQEAIDNLHFRWNHASKFKTFQLEEMYTTLVKQLEFFTK